MRFYSAQVRGVHATQDINANEQIVTLPLKVLITEALGQQTEMGRTVHESGVHLTVPNHCQVCTRVYGQGGIRGVAGLLAWIGII